MYLLALIFLSKFLLISTEIRTFHRDISLYSLDLSQSSPLQPLGHSRSLIDTVIQVFTYENLTTDSIIIFNGSWRFVISSPAFIELSSPKSSVFRGFKVYIDSKLTTIEAHIETTTFAITSVKTTSDKSTSAKTTSASATTEMASTPSITVKPTTGVSWSLKNIFGHKFALSNSPMTELDAIAACIVDGFNPMSFDVNFVKLKIFLGFWPENVEYWLFINDDLSEGIFSNSYDNNYRSDLHPNIASDIIDNNSDNNCVTCMVQGTIFMKKKKFYARKCDSKQIFFCKIN